MKEYKHDELAVKASLWLHSKTTFAGVRSDFEIRLAREYVADYVATGWLQYRFMQRYQINCGEWELGPDMVMIPKSDSLPGSFVFVFEAKASRSDFLSTFNGTEHHANRRTPVGSLHWCVANHNVCEVSELPDFWGLLVPSGRGLKEIRRPVYNVIEQAFVNELSYALLWKNPWSRHDRILAAITSGAS